MRIVDPGHSYELRKLDFREFDPEYWPLRFVKREGEGYPGNVGHYSGTTMQEVLRAVVQRAEYVNKQIPCEETAEAIDLCKKAIYLLEVRAAKRHDRCVPESVDEAVYSDTCPKCGHVGCKGECHRDSMR